MYLTSLCTRNFFVTFVNKFLGIIIMPKSTIEFGSFLAKFQIFQILNFQILTKFDFWLWNVQVIQPEEQ